MVTTRLPVTDVETVNGAVASLRQAYQDNE